MNTKYQVYAVVNDMMETDTLVFTDSPNKAIKCFFKNQKKYPSCVAIIADKLSDTKLLLEFASDRHDFIEECYEKYEHIPYSKDYILSEVDRCAKLSKYNKDRVYLDQVHPFSLG